jgi:hypothetical protein
MELSPTAAHHRARRSAIEVREDVAIHPIAVRRIAPIVGLR